MGYTSHFLFPSFFLLLTTLPQLSTSRNLEAILSLKPSIDPLGILKWPPTQGSNNVCQWQGVKQCLNGTITKLVIEKLNLKGTLDPTSLNHLDQLRVLSFKQNSLHGQIPQLLGLKNLKSLFLQDNDFSGRIPFSLASMHRLKVVDLSGNKLSGDIPQSLTSIRRLLLLYLENNQLSGSIPPFNQTSLKFFNVSNNKLYGKIPTTPSLIKFNNMSFIGNIDLCGKQVDNPCPIIPSYPNPILPTTIQGHHKNRDNKLILILVLSGSGFIISFMLVGIWVARSTRKNEKGSVANEDEERTCSNVGSGFCWEQRGEEIGSLVFLGEEMSYSLEDLLKASAETLGRGMIGSTYKAVMETGYIVTVKRLKDSRYPGVEEFRRHVEILGRLRHHNLVPLRAYFQAEEERLLVYDYFPNGSLFTLLHGSRRGVGGRCKPLHWTACLKISEDLATGLVYIHHPSNGTLAHGNLKSSNVLLGPDFESCLTDYGLSTFTNHPRQQPTQLADVYSFGVLLVELLTGKTPPDNVDMEGWVRSVWEEESTTTDQSGSSNEAREDKLGALLKIAVTCVSENRPRMKEVLRMIKEARAEAHLSSSSNNSPGRWWDAVQILPREEPLSM